MTVVAPYSATYTVTGMTCGHCVASVTEELTALPEVTGVDVDLPTGAVTVASRRELSTAEVVAAITEAGYQLSN
ncbi:MAG TPA: heavy-metal-associated domain-containing protein [Pseudonocardiaceae bacterium]|jgi:copper chaperone CopZ|nr:heavy-metal-associated domain-containing protein [Pseudonocardiaceae bacterium]